MADIAAIEDLKFFKIPGAKKNQTIFSGDQIKNIQTNKIVKNLGKDPNDRYQVRWAARYAGFGATPYLLVVPNSGFESPKNPNLGGESKEKFLKKTQDAIFKLLKKNKRVGAGTKSEEGIIELDTGPKLVGSLIDKPLYND